MRGRPAALGGRGRRDGSGGGGRRYDHLTMPVRKEQSHHNKPHSRQCFLCESEMNLYPLSKSEMNLYPLHVYRLT